METGQRPVKVSLTVITKNEAANLPACLDSVAGLFDEVVIVDTGSTDDTKDVARGHGAQVSDFAWIGDFAAARNAALDRATGDYAAWLDADDRVPPDQHPKLKALLDGLRPGDEAGYLMRVRTGIDDDVIDHLRHFPLRPDVRWICPIHEQIATPLGRAGVPILRADVTIQHLGYADPQLLARKAERNARIAEAHVPEPLRLAVRAYRCRDWEALPGHLAAMPPVMNFHCIRIACALAGIANQRLGEAASALTACDAWLAGADPDDPEFLYLRGVLLFNAGEPAEAEACLSRAVEPWRPERFTVIEPGYARRRALRCLAILFERRRDDEAARWFWFQVLDECPDDGAMVAEAAAALRRLAPA